MNIMDLRVDDHGNPQLAAMDRQLNKLRETGEKFIKILRSPRRENSYGTRSSSSNTGASSALSFASTSRKGPFMVRENENSLVKEDISENSRSIPPGETLAPIVESGMQANRVTKSSINYQVQNLDLSSPRDILASKFGYLMAHLIYDRSLDLPRHVWEDVEAVISEEAVDTSRRVLGEVKFHPTFTRHLSFRVLAGNTQQRGSSARAKVCVPSGVSNAETDCSNGNSRRRLSWTASGSQ